MARVTLQTIADHIGVSRTTVSNAYCRPDQLTPELRQRVFEAADRLGYRGPNAAARMLRTGKIGTIGLVFTEDLNFVFSDPSTSMFMRGVAEAASAASIGLTMLPVDRTVPLAETALRSAPVDGYLLFSVADSHPVVETLLGYEAPVVVIDEPDLGDRTSFVGIDDRAAARVVGEHIAASGHERVAILVHRIDDLGAAGPATHDDLTSSPVRIVRERYLGYLDGLGDLGHDPVLWSAGEMSIDAGRRMTRTMLEFHPDVTAIICMTDQLAIGASQALWRIGGVNIPNDVAVVGFDDIPRAESWDVPLTTLRQPLAEKGRLAAELLLERLEGGAPTRRILPTELVIRRSS